MLNRKIVRFVLVSSMLSGIVACNKEVEKQEVTIVYTNDTHTYFNNEDKEDAPALRVSNIAAYVEDLKNEGKNVLFLDAGDHVQGSAYGSFDKGSAAIEIFNTAKYDAATIGNHEFDYGMEVFKENAKKAKFKYLSCNFKHSGVRVVDDSAIFKLGSMKIAVVGVSTPATITSSIPSRFVDEDGNMSYSFDGDTNKENLYTSFQESVNKVKNKADYVIGLGHLGVGSSQSSQGISSEDLLKNTNGVSAFIDGHSHTVLENEKVKNKDNVEVTLTQTGANLDAFGVMTIKADGSISTELKHSYNKSKKEVKELEDKLYKDVEDSLGKVIAKTPSTLYINNPDKPDQRIVRSMETNLGDMCSDAFYWYFNKKMDVNCDVAFANGGGIRRQVEAGDISYLTAKNVYPFSNIACLVKVTGQQLLNYIEMRVGFVGQWDEARNGPVESGGYIHAAGIRYQIDASIPSTISKYGEPFVAPTKYKTQNVEIYNKQTSSYEAIDLNKEYTIAGTDYLLLDGGDDVNFVGDATVMMQYVEEDYMVLAEYFSSFKAESNVPTVTSENSPLKEYKNYMLNYENPYGANRIEILNAKY